MGVWWSVSWSVSWRFCGAFRGGFVERFVERFVEVSWSVSRRFRVGSNVVSWNVSSEPRPKMGKKSEMTDSIYRIRRLLLLYKI